MIAGYKGTMFQSAGFSRFFFSWPGTKSPWHQAPLTPGFPVAYFLPLLFPKLVCFCRFISCYLPCTKTWPFQWKISSLGCKFDSFPSVTKFVLFIGLLAVAILFSILFFHLLIVTAIGRYIIASDTSVMGRNAKTIRCGQWSHLIDLLTCLPGQSGYHVYILHPILNLSRFSQIF